MSMGNGEGVCWMLLFLDTANLMLYKNFLTLILLMSAIAVKRFMN